MQGAGHGAFEQIEPADWRGALEALAITDPGPGDEATRAAARVALQLYRERFEIPFVSAALTSSAEELLMRVRIRLGNDRAAEEDAAREEVRRIVGSRGHAAGSHEAPG